ncbi:MAG: hypothetical protein AB7U61_07135 [Methylocystis sp.]
MSVLLLRHGGSPERAQEVVEYLLAHADAAETIMTPTIEALIAAAHARPQTHEATRAVGGQRR